MHIYPSLDKEANTVHNSLNAMQRSKGLSAHHVLVNHQAGWTSITWIAIIQGVPVLAFLTLFVPSTYLVTTILSQVFYIICEKLKPQYCPLWQNTCCISPTIYAYSSHPATQPIFYPINMLLPTQWTFIYLYRCRGWGTCRVTDKRVDMEHCMALVCMSTYSATY